MKLILDLFCGSKSLKKIADNLGYEYIGVDSNPKCNADVCINILDWNYKTFFENRSHPFIIWGSPPCTEYSKFNNALPNKIPNIPYANSIVQKTIEIINYLKPVYWMIENPQTGTLKNQVFMNTLNYKDVTYCKYGSSHRKQTRIWNNLTNWIPKTLCLKNDKCSNMKHTTISSIPLHQRYAVPQNLLTEIIDLCV